MAAMATKCRKSVLEILGDLTENLHNKYMVAMATKFR